MFTYHEGATSNILIVDDEPNNLKVLFNLLSEYDYIVRAARDGASALESARINPPDLILLDIKMPKMDGYAVCRELKADSRTAHIPIIFVSAMNHVEDIVAAFNSGGVDYVTKPFQFEEVIARVKTHLTLVHQQNKLRWQSEQLELMAQRDRERFEKITQMREQFVRGAAHDLKNPLTLVGGYAEMMLRMEPVRKDPLLKEMVQEIEASGSEMLDLIRNMLDVLRFQNTVVLEKEKIDLNRIVEDVVITYQSIAYAKDIDLDYSSQYSEIYVDADAKLIQRVVENLVSNAIKYSPNNTHIHVSTTCQEGKAVMLVSDQGYGIPEYEMPLLFDPFYRAESTSDKADGTGLGLSIAKEIIDQHGGHIEVASQEGEGSEFKVMLASI